MSEALFEYRIRRSARSRRLRLRITLEHGLEVLVPPGFKAMTQIPRLLEQKRRWISAALARAEANRTFFDPSLPWRLPETIALPALARHWSVHATPRATTQVRWRARGQDGLAVSGPLDDEAACRAALGRWLTRQAQAQLVPRLQQLSQRTGLRYRRAAVRRQRTRWASCSRTGAISLNVRLLFLPPALADYVLLHELCHTVEMNHSPRFWALLARHCPDYRELDRALREMWERVPRWAR